jgi:hypothetical protein
MKIKAGDRFKCIKSLSKRDINWVVTTVYNKGYIYSSTLDNHIIDDIGYNRNVVALKLPIEEYFIKLNKYDETNPRINHPEYYNKHPSGVECIDITRHYCFSIGNAIKYLWRAGLKTEEGLTSVEKELEDLEKAIWYINDRIETLKKGCSDPSSNKNGTK